MCDMELKMFIEVKNTLISHFMLVLPLKYVSSVAPVHLSCIDTRLFSSLITI